MSLFPTDEESIKQMLAHLAATDDETRKKILDQAKVLPPHLRAAMESVMTAPDGVTISRSTFRYDAPTGNEDWMEAVATQGGITITIEEPWAGDSESGFGATTSIRMDYRVARAFAVWLGIIGKPGELR